MAARNVGRVPPPADPPEPPRETVSPPVSSKGNPPREVADPCPELLFYERYLEAALTCLTWHREADGTLYAHLRLGRRPPSHIRCDQPASGTDAPARPAYLLLTTTSVEEAERVFGMLADGGTVCMPIVRTSFAPRFSMLRDRFGTSWMLLCLNR